MNMNPFANLALKIKSRKNPKGDYSNLSTQDLLAAVKQSANSTNRGNLDLLLEVFLDRYNARQTELDNINHSLENQIQAELKLSQANQKKYEQQSKMAVMGEMMDAIAHQWKQPLNALSMMSQLLESDFYDEEVDDKYISQYTNDTHLQIKHMTDTLSEFRNFFRTKEIKEYFSIAECIKSMMVLIRDEFIKNNIYIEVINKEDVYINENKNELIHLILNIINNAKDEFNERNIKDRKIVIDFTSDGTHINLSITDSAGGISEKIIDKIFLSEFTTKKVGIGTGIGLYMSMKIAKKWGGSLSVKNVQNGASFLLSIPL